MSQTIQEASGSCVCGAVSFRISGPYRGFQYCHCGRCRKRTGSAHVANLFVPVQQFEWLTGEDRVKRFELPTAKYWSTAFCQECGSAAPWMTKNGKVMVVGAGSLDSDPGARPGFSIHYGSRAPWYVHVSELPIHDALPPRD